jgi:hypothetical protein
MDDWGFPRLFHKHEINPLRRIVKISKIPRAAHLGVPALSAYV